MSALDRTEAPWAANESRLLAQLKQEASKLCDCVNWVQTSRRGGDLEADLDALEEQAAIVRGLL